MKNPDYTSLEATGWSHPLIKPDKAEFINGLVGNQNISRTDAEEVYFMQLDLYPRVERVSSNPE